MFAIKDNIELVLSGEVFETGYNIFDIIYQFRSMNVIEEAPEHIVNCIFTWVPTNTGKTGCFTMAYLKKKICVQ